MNSPFTDFLSPEMNSENFELKDGLLAETPLLDQGKHESVSENENISEDEEPNYENESPVIEGENAVERNKNYSADLGWGNYIYEINDPLLTATGQPGRSLGQTDFVSDSTFGPFVGFTTEYADMSEPEGIESFEELNEVQEEDELYASETQYENEIHGKFDVDPAYGVTDYINVSAVKSKSLLTGIFIPAGFRPSEKVDVIIYLHGLYRDRGNLTNGIEYYWKNYTNIRNHFYVTQRNAILIAPTLSSDPQQENVIFNELGGFDKFLTACLKAIQAKSYLPGISDFNNIIIAAHSAGGRPLSRILAYPGVYKEKVIECWGFDCLYSDAWATDISDWATGNKKFYHYWAWSCNPKTLYKCPRVIGDKFTGNPNFINIDPVGKPNHQEVIENAWLYPILNRSWFSPLTNATPEIKEFDPMQDQVAYVFPALLSESWDESKFYKLYNRETDIYHHEIENGKNYFSKDK